MLLDVSEPVVAYALDEALGMVEDLADMRAATKAKSNLRPDERYAVDSDYADDVEVAA